MARHRITIIGGGFSGSMLAAQLAHLPGGPYTGEVHLVEPRPWLGPGLAHGTPYNEHLLNVRASHLSAFPDAPADFREWLHANHLPEGHDGFCSRQTYGQYLRAITAGLLMQPAPNGLRFFWHQQSAVAATLAADGQTGTVRLADGQELHSDHIILALGNFPPLAPGAFPAAVLAHPGYHNNPWAPEALASIAPTDSVLLIGTGLTTVDVLMTLRKHNFRGELTALSRRGRWPAAHGPAEATYPDFAGELAGLTTVGAVLRVVRRHVRAAATRGIDWRPVLDSLRPHLGAIWRAWPAAEQARFLRHLAPVWSVVRHRSPAQNAAALAALQATSQLRTLAGRISELQPAGPDLLVRVRQAAQLHELRVQHVINCTGPLLDYGRVTDPLVHSLREAGWLVPDSLRLGIVTDAHGALLDQCGHPSQVLYTLGPSRRPQSFESTAVPELRQQAAELATTLAAKLSA